MELDLVAMLFGAVLGLVAGATLGILAMFFKVLSPLYDLLGEVDKILNKFRGVSGGGGGGGGGILGLANTILPLLAGKVGVK